MKRELYMILGEFLDTENELKSFMEILGAANNFYTIQEQQPEQKIITGVLVALKKLDSDFETAIDKFDQCMLNVSKKERETQ
jgi:hypothetical protein